MFFRKHRELADEARRYNAVAQALQTAEGGIYSQRDNLQDLTVHFINHAPALLAKSPEILDCLDSLDAFVVAVLRAADMPVDNPAPSALPRLLQAAQPLPYFGDAALVPHAAEEVIIELQGARPLDRSAVLAQLRQVMQRLESGDVIGEADDGVVGYRFTVRDASNAPQFFHDPKPTTSTRR